MLLIILILILILININNNININIEKIKTDIKKKFIEKSLPAHSARKSDKKDVRCRTLSDLKKKIDHRMKKYMFNIIFVSLIVRLLLK